MNTPFQPKPMPPRSIEQIRADVRDGFPLGVNDYMSLAAVAYRDRAQLLALTDGLLAALRAFVTHDPELDNAREAIARAAIAKADGRPE